MLTYIVGPFLALLPRRWRSALFGGLPINWPRAAALSGFVECFGCLVGLVGWYISYAQRSVSLEGISFLGGVILATSHPIGMTLVYFFAEGLVRTFAGLFVEEAPGILPLAVVERLVSVARKKAYEARVPLVADKVTVRDGKQPWDLRVESCRPKPTWKYPLTVEFKGNYFQMREEAVGDSPARPHVYLLKRVPAGEAYRGMEHYDPTAVLRPVELEPGILRGTAEALRDGFRMARLPLVADQIYRGDGKAGWHLRVESCRPKPDWTQGRIVRFEERYYRVENSYEAKSPRPFGFELRMLAAGVPGRRVLPYSPEDVLRSAR